MLGLLRSNSLMSLKSLAGILFVWRTFLSPVTRPDDGSLSNFDRTCADNTRNGCNRQICAQPNGWFFDNTAFIWPRASKSLGIRRREDDEIYSVFEFEVRRSHSFTVRAKMISGGWRVFAFARGRNFLHTAGRLSPRCWIA